MSKKYLILGHGYTATFLKNEIEQKDRSAEVFSTSRKGGAKIEFNIIDNSTWENLPDVDGTFWLFPARPEGKVKTFISEKKEKLGKLVVLGSTGGFKSNKEHQLINESSTLDSTIDRVRSEKHLMNDDAVLVYASGIYGPERDPKSWIEGGFIKPSDKFLNAIHVEDLAQILVAAMANGEGGSLYIASDNNPNTWNQIVDHWTENGGVALHEKPKESKKMSKKIDSSKSLKELKVKLKHPNIIV